MNFAGIHNPPGQLRQDELAAEEEIVRAFQTDCRNRTGRRNQLE